MRLGLVRLPPPPLPHPRADGGALVCADHTGAAAPPVSTSARASVYTELVGSARGEVVHTVTQRPLCNGENE